MLLSLRELVVWTGLGPLEVALHSFALVVFVCLTTLQLEGAIAASWHAVFSPLYVALGLHLYYLSVLSVRMVTWGLQQTRCAKRALPFLIASHLAGVGSLLFVEFATAAYLNGGVAPDKLIWSLALLLVYLSIRLCFLFATQKSPAPRDY